MTSIPKVQKKTWAKPSVVELKMPLLNIHAMVEVDFPWQCSKESLVVADRSSDEGGGVNP